MTDGEDVRTRVEDALRRAAATAYEAAHGALGDHGALENRGALEGSDDADASPRWRFRVSSRAAVTATIVVAVLGAMIVFLPPTVSRASLDGETASIPPSGESVANSATAAPLAAFSATSAGLTGAAPDGSVVVHVAGAVTAPGLYTLEGGARVADAVAAAGGAAEGANLDSLNLARVVVDGEQVRVPLTGETFSDGATGPDGKVNINTADVTTLERLPGVGPVLAKRIAEYRKAHGPFASVDALDDVSGIGPAMLEKVRAAATV